MATTREALPGDIDALRAALIAEREPSASTKR